MIILITQYLWFTCLGVGLLSPQIWTMIILITLTMSVVCVFGGRTYLTPILDNDHIDYSVSVVHVFGGGTSFAPNLDNDHIDYSDNVCGSCVLGAGLLSPPIWTMIILITQCQWFTCLGAGLLSPLIWTTIILITQTMVSSRQRTRCKISSSTPGSSSYKCHSVKSETPPPGPPPTNITV